MYSIDTSHVIAACAKLGPQRTGMLVQSRLRAFARRFRLRCQAQVEKRTVVVQTNVV